VIGGRGKKGSRRAVLSRKKAGETEGSLRPSAWRGGKKKEQQEKEEEELRIVPKAFFGKRKKEEEKWQERMGGKNTKEK